MRTASALSAQPSHCWPLMDSAYTRAHTRRKKSFSPLASLWRSSNQMSYAAHSWSLFISKTKALPTTSCLPLMSQRGCSPVFVLDSELEKERNALRPECYRVNIDANCWADSKNAVFYSMLTLRPSQRTENFQRRCKSGQSWKTQRLKYRGVAAMRKFNIWHIQVQVYFKVSMLHVAYTYYYNNNMHNYMQVTLNQPRILTIQQVLLVN